jgi:hypothetical protein
MTIRDPSPIPRGSPAFEKKLNEAAAQGVQDAIDRENERAAKRAAKLEESR